MTIQGVEIKTDNTENNNPKMLIALAKQQEYLPAV